MRTVAEFFFAGASLLALSAPAFGQASEAPPTENNVPGAEPNEGFTETDIVVTARRRDESSQDVPLVVNAVTSEELAKLNIREFQDITRAVPGLALSTSPNGIGTQATLRGVAYDVNVSGNNGTIEFYLNDAPTSSAIVFQTMFDVSQIEVLRGPQGTLRGRASPSGSITIVTKRPDLDEVGGYVNLSGTTRNLINVNAAVGVPIIRDMLALRVAGVFEEGDGNRVHSINNGANPFVRTWGTRASLRFDPTDSLTFDASFTKTVRTARQFDQAESVNLTVPGLAASPVLVRATDRLAVEPIPRTFKQDFDVWNWRAEFRFAGQKLNYVGSYNKQRYDSLDPNDKGAFFVNTLLATFTAIPGPPFGGVPTVATIPSFFPLGQSNRTRGTQETHELRLSSDERLFGVLDYVVGALLLKTNTETNLNTQTPIINRPLTVPNTNPAVPTGVVVPTLISNTPVQRPSGTTEKSVFVNLTAHLGDRTELSGGMRYIHYAERASLFVFNARTGVFDQILAAERPSPGEQPAENVIWSASAKHRFSDNLMAYASFGTSWRPGSNTNAIIDRDNVVKAAPIDQFLVVPAETSQSYEIGFKSDWLDRRLKFNASAFLQNFENYAYQSQNIISVSRTSAADPGRIVTLRPGLSVGLPVQVKGVEAELSWNTPRFSAGASVAYSISKIKNGVIPCNDYFPNDGAPDSSGQIPATVQDLLDANNGGIFSLCTVNYRAANLAPFSANLQAEYNTPISGRVDGYVRGLAAIYGNSQNDPGNAIDDIPAYALVNLYAGIRDPEGAWDVGLFAKNLFNVERVLTREASPFQTSYQNLLLGANAGQNGVTTYRGITMTPPREFGINVRYSFGSR